MLTVDDAARHAGRNPETIRRWIRGGRLRAERVGRRHMIDEDDLATAVEEPFCLPLPKGWGTFDSGRPVPDPVRAIEEARRGR